MASQSFNLTTDPWIKVVETNTGQEKCVSLIEFFTHAQDYRQLAGEMRSQDLSIMRFLLAILTTVYSRYDANDNPYSWVTIDSYTMKVTVVEDDMSEKVINKKLLNTWDQLYKAEKFSKIVIDYLKHYKSRFDMFGDHPFYQVTTDEYDALVPSNKRIEKEVGQVQVKQLNRRISESGNKTAIFAPKAGELKNAININELVRWLITYQNFTGVSDKTKIQMKEKFSKSAGWLYRLNPVYAQGKTVFETLLLNLKLDSKRINDTLVLQKPVWEYEVQDYVAKRKQQLIPDNVAELYTAWSRILHIEWQDDKHPIIFSAGIPMFESTNAFIEPMTTWRIDKVSGKYYPAAREMNSLGISMWRGFGNYVDIHSDSKQRIPGIVSWLRNIKDQGTSVIADDKLLILTSTTLIRDELKAQAPGAEVVDDIRLQADVLFDSKMAEYWPVRIENAIDVTQTVGKNFYYFAKTIGRIRYGKTPTKIVFANNLSAKFYQNLNEPFKEWLSQLTGNDDREWKIEQWKEQLKSILNDTVRDVMKFSSPRDVNGIEDDKLGPVNIFTAQSLLMRQVSKNLDPWNKE